MHRSARSSAPERSLGRRENGFSRIQLQRAKSVSTSSQRLQSKPGCSRAKLLAQVRNMGLDNIRVVLPREVIEVLQQFLFRDDRLWTVQKVLQHSILRWRYSDALAVDQYSLLAQIYRNRSKLNCRLPNPFAASHQGSRTCNQFAEVERLRDIIIRSEIEQFDGASSLRYGCDDENRSVVASAAKSAQNLLASQTRQHQIQQNQIIARSLAQEQCLSTISRDVHGITGALTQSCSHVL